MLIRQGLALPEKMSRQSLGGPAIRMKRAQDLCSTYRLGVGAWLLGDRLVLEGITGSSFHQDNPGGDGPIPITVTGEVCRKSQGAVWLGFGGSISSLQVYGHCLHAHKDSGTANAVGREGGIGAGEISSLALQRV